MSIRIRNDSTSVLVRGYTCTQAGTIVWLEMAPQHPKVVGAIRAEMTSNSRKYMNIADHDKGVGHPVTGIGRGYIVQTMDAPNLAVGNRARAALVRLIAPAAIQPASVSDEFYALAWPGISPAISAASILEKYSPLPVRLAWGEYLLQEALKTGYAEPLICGGHGPEGYKLEKETPWADLILKGIQSKRISLTD